MKLILASGSQRRKELMQMCGYEFDIVVSDADENIIETKPRELVTKLAELKARSVFEKLQQTEEDYVVVGSDTVVAFNGEIIGKPTDSRNAAEILKKLSGNTHTVYTGVAVLTKDSVQLDCSTTDVTFATLNDDEIEKYIKTGEPMDKAGAYGIQGPFGMFVERIEGNYFTVIGMPLPMLYNMLKNVKILPIFFN